MLFEKVLITEALMEYDTKTENFQNHNQLLLFKL